MYILSFFHHSFLIDTNSCAASCTVRAFARGICVPVESLAYRGIIKRAQSVGSVPLVSFIISGRR